MADQKNKSNARIDAPAHLEVEGLGVVYGSRPVLCDISFQVPEGTRVAVVGPNGAGKSTLFKAMVGLVPAHSGRVLVHGLPFGQHQDCVAYVPQREEVDWRFPVSVSDVVMMGRYGQLGWLRRPGLADRRIVARALEQMNLTALAGQPIGELSGGQQQRAFLARALAQEPHILLMDEPFTGVDIATQEATLALLDDLRDHQVTVMVSTHDLTLAAERFDQVLLLNRELIAYGTSAVAFRPDMLSKAFGSQLLLLPNGAALVDQCCPADEEHTHAHTHAHEEPSP
ncbi:MAG TPA: metal ABC transporter ATP-binding protein [Anaerolineae bacterium]